MRTDHILVHAWLIWPTGVLLWILGAMDKWGSQQQCQEYLDNSTEIPLMSPANNINIRYLFLVVLSYANPLTGQPTMSGSTRNS